MEAGKTLIRGGQVVPISGPALADGGILVDRGRVAAVGTFAELDSRHPSATSIDRSACTLVPGLVNAHAHLELSEFKCGPSPASFTEWLARLVPRGQVTAESVGESVARSIPIGIEQCLRFGVTCVGDISRHCAVSRALLRNGPLRVVSYGEVQAMARRRELLEERVSLAIDPRFTSEFLHTGLSPHAPYSVELEGYRRCARVAKTLKLPMATHLAETPDEAPFLADHEGPFRELWNHIGAWDQDVPRFAGGPIRFAREAGLLDYPTLLAHVNYCDDSEMALLAQSPASVVYCPRTHAFFRHPPHRWRDMLASGINVALGTDSCASSPNLNLLDDMRLLRQIAPEIPARVIWEMATIRAARALQIDQSVGSIEPGKFADLAVFQTVGPEPLAEILDRNLLPCQTWISGEQRSP